MLNKTLQKQVAFAWFCIDNDCEPAALARAIVAVNKSVTAYTRCNNKDREKHMRDFEDIAWNELNLTDVSWPGLYPMFKDKSGYETMLPD